MILILFLISILLEGILPNLLCGFIFFFVIADIVLLYNFTKDKKYYVYIFILGIFYDLFYTSFLFLHGFIFLFLSFLLNKIFEENNGYIKQIFIYLLSIVIYILIMIIVTINYNNYDFYMLINMFLTSLVFNIIYFSLSYFVIKKLFWNRKKIKTYK